MRDKLFVTVLLVALALVGCGGGNDDPPEVADVEVSRTFGSPPVVQIDTPLPMADASSEIIVRGDGRALEADGPALLALTAYDGTTGEPLVDRGAGEPRTVVLSRDDVGEEIYPRLLDTPEGSRLLVMQPVAGDEGDHMLVLVIDVLYSAAQGDERDLPEAFPDIEIEVGETGPQVTLPDEDAPEELEVAPVIDGQGSQVSLGQEVTLQYVAVVWPGGEVYDSTWADGQVPRTIVIDDAFPGLRDGLVDRAVGSRVVLSVPPELGTGTETLLFVVDILATTDQHGTEVPEPSPSESPSE